MLISSYVVLLVHGTVSCTMMVHYVLMVMLNLTNIHADMDEAKKLKISKLFLTVR